MRRKYISIIAMIVFSIGLSGCVIPTIQDMTEEQEAVITEYAAGLLLKYDSNGSRGLMSDEELEKAAQEEALKKERDEKNKQLAQEYLKKTEEARKKKEEEKASKKSESDKQDAVATKGDIEVAANNIGSCVDCEDLDIAFNGFEIATSYPGDGNSDLFSVDAKDGKKLVVANISIANNATEDKYIDIFEKSYIFKLDISDSASIYSSSTLLLNDLSMFKDTVAAGKTTDTVLLFEVDDSVDVSNANLTIINGKNIYKVIN